MLHNIMTPGLHDRTTARPFVLYNNIRKFAFPLKDNDKQNTEIPSDIFRAAYFGGHYTDIQCHVWSEHSTG